MKFSSRIASVLFSVTALALPNTSQASFFSTSGVIDGSNSYSVTVGNVTMTIDNPSPNGLQNHPDAYSALDFGNGSGLLIDSLLSFDVSFDKDMLVSSVYEPAPMVFTTVFSISGTGAFAQATVKDQGTIILPSGPLYFLANERYTFSYVSGAAFPLGGFEATAVPIPSAMWLLSSSFMGLIGVSRYRK